MAVEVLVRSFNCESRVCVMLEALEEVVFRVREKMFYSRKFHESWILWIIIIVYITTCSGLPPPAAPGPAGEWYRTIGP